MSIIINNLSKSYGEHVILDKINLTIDEGSIFGLLGPNGAGKSTLVSILNNILNKDSGSIEFFGKDFDKNTSYVKENSSYVPQTYAFYPDLTAVENLQFFGSLYGLKGQVLRERIAYCIEFTSLEKYSHRRAYTFSGGVKRRLNIAIGLLNNPKILYLDEPTVGIDPQSRNYILQMIKELNQESQLTIVYTSHYMEEIEFLCDDIAILDKSHILLHEKKELLLDQTKYIEVTLKNGKTTQINTKESYADLVAYLKENPDIADIHTDHKNLEEMFLKLTKQDLRD